jgi:hypothetical protein
MERGNPLIENKKNIWVKQSETSYRLLGEIFLKFREFSRWFDKRSIFLFL